MRSRLPGTAASSSPVVGFTATSPRATARRKMERTGSSNAGANTAANHITVLDASLEQLPADVADRDRDEPTEILARADAGGATHAFAAALRERRIRFSLGFYVTETVGQAALALPDNAWRPAVDGDGEPRDGAWVAELTGHVDLAAWPEGTRLI